VPLLIVGAGAAGLCAALAASEAGVEPVVIERDAVPAARPRCRPGSSRRRARAFSARGIEDSAKLFADDIARKAHGEADAKLVRAVASTRADGRVARGLLRMPFEVITDFNYPGHSAHRMHGLPSRTGAELIDRLRGAAEARDIPILTGRVCETLFADEDGFIEGVEIRRAARETIGCGALVLACNGYGGNAELVRRSFPRWPMRSTSAIRAIRATRCCGARRSARGWSLSAAIRARLGRDAAQHSRSPGRRSRRAASR
jgi:fumarate reductase flavoprotein subunit